MSKSSQLEQALRSARFTELSHDSGEPCEEALLLKLLLSLQNHSLSPDHSLEQSLNLADNVTLTQYHANVLYFCDQLFQLCQLKAEIDPSFIKPLLFLRPVVAAIILENGLNTVLEHPLCKLLDTVWHAALYWTPLLGKSGDKYKMRIEDILQRIRITDPTHAAYADWLTEFTEQLHKDTERAERLASRINQSERDSWIRKQSHQIVQHNVNRILLYADMPEAVELLLKGPLRDSLHQTLLNAGIESAEWHNLLRLAEYLLDSVHSPQNEKEKKQVYKLIPKIPGMLKKHLTSIANPDELQEWISSIEALHVQLLMEQPLLMRSAEPLPLIASHMTINTTISSALIDQISHIWEGQWLVYHDENNQPLLCKLSIKLESAGQLLFVNVLGARCLQKSFSEFAYLLSAKHVYLLNADNNFSQAVRDTLYQFMLMHRFHTLMQADESDRRKREIAKVQTQAERRRLAQLKALQEAEFIARQRQEETKRTKMKDMETAITNARQKMQLDAQKLTVGAWLEMEIDGIRQKCRLAAILNTTDTFILTGRDGIKLSELPREVVVRKVIDGTAVILENGHRFEDSLEKMIHTLRKT